MYCILLKLELFKIVNIIFLKIMLGYNKLLFDMF